MSVQAEAAVLGAALSSEKAADQVCDLLTADMFANEAHRTVYGVVAELRGRGMAADTTTVQDELIKADRLDQVGGPVGLYDLVAQRPVGGLVEQWAGRVRETWRARRLRQVVGRLSLELDDPEGVDDLDGLVEQAVSELTSSGAAPATVDRDRLLESFEVRVERGAPAEGWSLPWTACNWFRLPDDGLTVLTGLPGSGKSTWLDAAIVGMLDTNPDLKVAFFSPEMSPADHHLWLLTQTKMGRLPAYDRSEASAVGRWLTERCWWIDDDRDSTASGVVAQARRLVRDEGVRLLVVDPYNNLEPDSGSHGDRQDLHIQALLRRLRRFARQTSTSVVVVAHPRRTEKVLGTDAVYRIPTAGDISGGQEWWNHADAIVTVWRNQSGEEPNLHGNPWQVKVIVSKCRFAKWGRVGKAKLRFDEQARRYSGVSEV